MNCDTFHELLSEHALGEVAPFEAAVIDAHLVECPACATLLAQARALAPLIEAALATDSFDDNPAPTHTDARPAHAVAQPAAPRPRLLARPLVAWACAAACAVAAILGWTRPGLDAADSPSTAPPAWTVAASPEPPPVAGALSLSRARQVDLSTREGAWIPMRFTWSDAVDPAALARRATAHTLDGKRVAIEAVSGRPAREVGLRFDVEPDVPFVLEIAAGLTGESGQRLAANLSRELVLARNLALLDHDLDWSGGEPRVHLDFNAPVDPASVEGRVACEPPVAFSYGVSGTRVTLVGGFEPSQRYRVSVRAGITTIRGRVALERPTERAVWIGERPPELEFAFAGRYLSSAGTGRVHVMTRGLSRFQVEVWRLHPENVAAYANDFGRMYHLGTRVGTREFAVTPRPDRATSVALSLEEVAGSARGLLHLILEPLRKEDGSAAERCGDGDQRRHVIVIASDLGVSCRLAGTELLCWTTSILHGTSVEGATVRAISSKNRELARGTSDATGLVRLALAPTDRDDGLALVTVEHELDQTYHHLNHGAQARPAGGLPYCAPDGLEAFITAARGMHRPGETVALDALVRDRAGVPPGTFPVELVLRSPDERVRAQATATLDAQGGVSAALVLDPTWPSGRWTALLRLPGGKTLGTTHFTVASFVPEALAVAIAPPTGRVDARAEIEIPVAARFLHGDPAAGLRVQATARWSSRALDREAYRGWSFGAPMARTLRRVSLDDRTTDASGAVNLVVPPLAGDVGGALELELEVAVLAPDQRPTHQTVRIPADAHKRYAALRVAPGAHLSPGEPVAIELALVDGGGQPIAGGQGLDLAWLRVHNDFVLERNGSGYHYRYTERTEPVGPDGARGQANVSDGAGTTAFRPPTAGHYRLVAGGIDTCSAQLEIVVVGEGADEPTSDASIAFAFERARHRAGEPARVQLSAPFAGLALLAIETDRVVWTSVREIPAGNTSLEVPVEAAWGSGACLSATLLRPATVHKGRAPARASGAAFLAIDVEARRLEIALDAPARARSGRPFEVVVRVQSGGIPVAGARVKLAAIDAGALSVDRSPDPDPYGRLCGPRASSVRESDLYGQLLPELAAGEAADPGGGEDPSGGLDLSPIHAKRFTVTAWHAPAVFTDASGAARIEVPLGRHHGAVRVLTWVAHDDRFGATGADVELSSPIMVDLALPRFLAPGDVCEGALIVRNRSEQDATIATAIAVEGPLEIAPLPATLHLAPGAFTRIPLVIRALSGAGVARVTATASLGDESDAETIEIPVRPAWPRTTQVLAGVVQAPARLVLEPPGEWFPGTASATLGIGAVPGLEHAGALDALVGYPHGCLEQTTSRAQALLVMGAVAGLVVAGGPSPEEIARRIDAAIARIGTMQRGNGMLGAWPDSGDDYAYGSVYAADFLIAARARGHAVDPHLLGALLDALAQRAVDSSPDGATEWGLYAYQAQVLRQAGLRAEVALGRLEAVHDGSLDATGRAHFARALAASNEATLAMEILAATLVKNGARSHDLDDLRSDTKERAVMVLALAEVAPRDPRLGNLVAELERALACPETLSTQDIGWALRAVERCARAEPARWTATLRHTATGRVARSFDATRALSLADPGGALALDIVGTGPFRYCWIARGTPARAADPIAAGITVGRRYAHARTGRSVSPDELVAGERYAVTLDLRLPRRVGGILLSELLPAGLELEGVDTAERTGDAKGLNPRPRIVRVEQRDDRLLVFCDLTAAREEPWSFEYIVRAVTPGHYTLPPVAAEAMYDPALRCVGAAGTAVVATR